MGEAAVRMQKYDMHEQCSGVGLNIVFMLSWRNVVASQEVSKNESIVYDVQSMMLRMFCSPHYPQWIQVVRKIW